MPAARALLEPLAVRAEKAFRVAQPVQMQDTRKPGVRLQVTKAVTAVGAAVPDP